MNEKCSSTASKFFVSCNPHCPPGHHLFREVGMKCCKTHRNAKKFFYPFDRLRASRVALSASGEAQPYLPHVTRRVPRSVHAKFHADWTKTVGDRGIQTNKRTNKQTELL